MADHIFTYYGQGSDLRKLQHECQKEDHGKSLEEHGESLNDFDAPTMIPSVTVRISVGHIHYISKSNFIALHIMKASLMDQRYHLRNS